MTIENKEYADIIQTVKNNLEYLSYLTTHGIDSVLTRTPSCTSSVIKVSKSNYDSTPHILKSICEQKEEIDFSKRMHRYIKALDPAQQDVIKKRYIDNYKMNDIIYGNANICGRIDAYRVLKKAYITLAIMDETINFTYFDYLETKKNKKKP